MRKLNLLFVMLLSLMGVTQVCAQEAITEGFDDFTGGWNSSWVWELSLPEGWDYSGTASTFSVETDNYKTKKPSVGITSSNTNSYLITPELKGDFSFYLRNQTKSYQASVTAYACTFVDGTLSLGSVIGSKTLSKSTSTPSWESVSFNTAVGTRVALLISRGYMDDFTYVPNEATEGPEYIVLDGSAAIESGATIDFGITGADATKDFTVKNTGTVDINFTFKALNNRFAVSPETAEIKAGEEQVVTITMPEFTAEDVIAITPSEEGLEPFTINVSGKIVPVMEVSLDGTEIADGFTDRFGKVSENATHTYTVSNLGTAVLNVAIASDNEEFVISPAFLEVDPANSATFDVTFNFNAENVGARTANITITPSTDDNAPVSFSVVANVADPNVWSEDFEGEGQPEGWEVGSSNWTFANGVARATYGSYSTGYKYFLTTPTLEVAEGESLEFQYRGTAYSTDIRIQMSKDGGEFEAFKTISCDNMTEFETYVIEGLEPGQYQFRFANDNYELDNFEGFKLAVLEHDMAITASDIPSSGDTASEYVASVTVQEKAGKDETVTAKLYIDGNVVATAEQEVAANEEATIELSFEPTEAVVFKNAYIEITYAEGLTKKTDEVSVYIQEVTVKVLDEVAVNEFSGTTETYDRVKLNYTVKQGWNTIAVPFMISDLSVFGEDVQAYQFSDYADGELKFSRTTMIPAATPCVFYTEAPSTKQISFDGVTIYSYNAVEENCAVTKNEATFQGTYAPIAAPGMQGKYGVVPSTGKIQKGGAGASIKALRAYFILPENVDGSKLIMTFVEEEGDATSIKGIENLNIENAEMFDLSGRKVIGQKKAGIYILNGKKVVVK